VSDVYNVPNEAIRETPDFGVGVRTDFVKGIAMVNERMLILLDIEQLVDDGMRASTDAAA
jgi:purine-binding chemotaxis protein CheW